jgi:ABC-type nitrate/sulfonate/bicarbonate transport system ATPase subunit
VSVLQVKNASFAYGGHLVLREIDVSVERGEFVSIIGPSGCGKSTLLSIIAGMLDPGIGEVEFQSDLAEGETARAVVFQDFALLPWKNVLSNVAMGLDYQRRGTPKAERRATAQRYVELVGLRGFERKFPYQISGGMKQRAGLARALAVEPNVLLLDEPFASIDAQNAELLRRELRELVSEQQRTAVLVTHNLDEALYLSDRILLMSTRPGMIREDVRVDLPFPRGPEMGDPVHQQRYAELRNRLWQHLVEEVAREKRWMDRTMQGGVK